MHAIAPHIGFKYIKRKENVLADSLLRLRYLTVHNDNDLEEPCQKYGKSILTGMQT